MKIEIWAYQFLTPQKTTVHLAHTFYSFMANLPLIDDNFNLDYY